MVVSQQDSLQEVIVAHKGRASKLGKHTNSHVGCFNASYKIYYKLLKYSRVSKEVEKLSKVSSEFPSFRLLLGFIVNLHEEK